MGIFPMYCVEARNRMTGEREVISGPSMREQAEAKKRKLVMSEKRDKAYLYPKVIPVYGDLFKK